jgi:hypothetical protein
MRVGACKSRDGVAEHECDTLERGGRNDEANIGNDVDDDTMELAGERVAVYPFKCRSHICMRSHILRN